VGNGRKRLALVKAETLACLLVLSQTPSTRKRPHHEHAVRKDTPLASQKDSPKFDWCTGRCAHPIISTGHAPSLDGKSERVTF
jgi:hypothetical protein